MNGTKQFAKWLYDRIPFKQPLYTALRAVAHVPEPIHRHLHFKGVITVPISPTEKFRIMHHGYMIENELFWQGFGGFEKISVELWARLCRRSDVIFDIGANTGLYALVAQTVNPAALVVAVEPVERIFRKLEANIALNHGNIRAFNAAASDRTGTAVLFDMPSSEHVFSVSLESDWNSASTQLRPVEVPCITVNDLLHRVGAASVDLLKIDVETHEPAVLKGFGEILRRDRPTLLIELLNDDVALQVAQLVNGLDYVYYNIDDITWPPQRVDTLTKSKHFNFLICQKEVAVAIGICS